MREQTGDPHGDQDGRPGRSGAVEAPRAESWEDRAVFRETFLNLHPEPEIRAAYRQVGVSLYEAALALEVSYVERGEPAVATDLRAVARDIWVAQAYLHDLGRQAEADTQDAASTQLCLLAAAVAEELEGILARISEAFPASGSADDEA
ncbi:MAG: hypothetical protein SX243_01165 [Acidobacteriota bacterium]|nr:hypothetical protein [Acidobacteriota bacterium]